MRILKYHLLGILHLLRIQKNFNIKLFKSLFQNQISQLYHKIQDKFI